MKIIRTLLYVIITLTIISCASLGSKTLFLNQHYQLQNGTKISIAKPTLIRVTQPIDEVQDIIKTIVSNELKQNNIVCESLVEDVPDFDDIQPDKDLSIPSSITSDYILVAKLERLVAMDITRDYKASYKLISVKDKKLVFYSKYSTTFGATVVVLPGIKDYPNTDQIMLIGITSGLHELKKKMIKK